ncbi:hypothetical protein [uncultured Paracoccus sp.]|uniref:hypothetical protein n=1 Tax=uncultured Paracoccus sp. TaxID=189685 RepID=UPI0026098A4A|nr:hypothetical protein [uncultured Paracoccus sp.]
MNDHPSQERLPSIQVNEGRLVLLSWVGLFAIAALNNFSLVSILVRGGALDETVSFGGGAVGLILGITVYSLPGACFVTYLAAGRRHAVTIGFLLIPLLIGNAPSGMARFHAAAIYIAIAVTLFSSLRRSSILLPAGLILGILVAFPTLNQFRSYEGGVPRIYILGIDDVTTGHFDSFQSIAGALNMPLTMGRQLLGVVLFWVPRSVWPDKPIGTGAEYADHANLSFSNISMNFFAEGVVNFGLLGAIAFAAVGGYLSALIDSRGYSQTPSLFWAVFSKFMIGMAFFMMRGDLLSSFAFSVGIAVTVHIVILFSTKRI